MVTSLSLQAKMIRFLRRWPKQWHDHGTSQRAVEVVCSLHNLGIIEAKEGRMRLKSREAADRFLRSHGILD